MKNHGRYRKSTQEHSLRGIFLLSRQKNSAPTFFLCVCVCDGNPGKTPPLLDLLLFYLVNNIKTGHSVQSFSLLRILRQRERSDVERDKKRPLFFLLFFHNQCPEHLKRTSSTWLCTYAFSFFFSNKKIGKEK